MDKRPMKFDYHGHVRDEVFPLITRGDRLLDFGGGNGATALAAKHAGLCRSAGVVDLVAPLDRGELDFAYCGDLSTPELLEQITTEQAPFDTILCLDILEHLIDPWGMVARLHTMLAPGGRIVASIPNVGHYSVSMPLLFAHKWDLADAGLLDRTHLRFFVRDSAVALMTSSGLRLEKVLPLFERAKRTRLIGALSFGPLKNLTAYQFAIAVRRDD